MEIISSITNVFQAMGEWLVSFINMVIPLFWVEGTGTGADAVAGHLTFLGVLAIIGLAISIFFLIMGLIENFLHLRG